jgi:hypothetical protein
MEPRLHHSEASHGARHASIGRVQTWQLPGWTKVSSRIRVAEKNSTVYGIWCTILDKCNRYYIVSDLLSNRRLRNSYFLVTLKNTHQLHFSRKKVQLVAVVLFFKLRLHFSKWLRSNNFSGDWHIGKPILYISMNVYGVPLCNMFDQAR